MQYALKESSTLSFHTKLYHTQLPPKKSFFLPLVCKLFAPPMASVRTITVYLQEYSNDIRIYLVTIEMLLDFAVLLLKILLKSSSGK